MIPTRAPDQYAAWRADNAEWLRLRLEELRLRLNRRALWLQREGADSGRTVDWLISDTDGEREAAFLARHPAATAIDALIGATTTRITSIEERMREHSRPPALRAIAHAAGLSALEEEILLLAAAPAIDGAFSRAYAELHEDARRDHASLHLALGLFVGDRTSRVLAADCLMPVRPLRALHLIELDNAPGEPLLLRRMTVDERLADYLRGVNRVDARVAPYLARPAPPLPSEAAERSAALITRLLQERAVEWPTVNLIGSVEGGARDVAAIAAEELGLELRSLDVARLADAAARGASSAALLLSLLGREALLGGAAFCVDANGLDRGGRAAAMVDDLIAQLSATLFVVSEERWPGEHPALVLAVAKPSRSEQGALWRAALSARAHSVNGEVDAITQQFDFGPPAIAAAVERAARRAGEGISGRDLWRACREEGGAALDDLATRVTPNYGWDDLVVPAGVRAQLQELASQVELRGRVYEGWGFGAQLHRGRGITAMFGGASGVGKTMAATILAAHLDLEMFVIDLAGVLDKYIGESEKRLRRLFAAAERSGAILFFDEADALFGVRTEVRDSHDKYANASVNCLLQLMELYTGVAILASNKSASVDPAFLRRLRFVIDFPVPQVEDRRRIWERVFPPQADRLDVDCGFLARLELTGGNIKTIAVNAAFLAAAESAPIGMAHIMRAAAREYRKLAKPIDAAEFGPHFAAVRQ